MAGLKMTVPFFDKGRGPSEYLIPGSNLRLPVDKQPREPEGDTSTERTELLEPKEEDEWWSRMHMV